MLYICFFFKIFQILDQLVCEAKKRSRMEWEDTVKTLTGKRPCRLAGDERRQPVASTPMVIPEEDVLTTMSTVNQTTEIASTPINEGHRITRTMLSRITHDATTMNPPLMTVGKSVKSNPVRRLSKQMRDRLLAKFDRNDTELSASELDQLQNLINSLQEFKNRCDHPSRRK
ncbi:unnamed protein product [Trichobilharzia szidati]|nr:unnamed protein product [Trichobilharzia szidati]